MTEKIRVKATSIRFSEESTGLQKYSQVGFLFSKFRERIIWLLFHQLNPRKARKFSLFSTLLYSFKIQEKIEHNKMKESGVEVT